MRQSLLGVFFQCQTVVPGDQGLVHLKLVARPVDVSVPPYGPSFFSMDSAILKGSWKGTEAWPYVECWVPSREDMKTLGKTQSHLPLSTQHTGVPKSWGLSKNSSRCGVEPACSYHIMYTVDGRTGEMVPSLSPLEL